MIFSRPLDPFLMKGFVKPQQRATVRKEGRWVEEVLLFSCTKPLFDKKRRPHVASQLHRSERAQPIGVLPRMNPTAFSGSMVCECGLKDGLKEMERESRDTMWSRALRQTEVFIQHVRQNMVLSLWSLARRRNSRGRLGAKQAEA